MAVRSSPNGEPGRRRSRSPAGRGCARTRWGDRPGVHTGDPMADTMQSHHAFCLFLYEFDGTGQAVPSVRSAQDVGSARPHGSTTSRCAPNARTRLGLDSGSRPGPGRMPPTIWIIGPMGTNRDVAGTLGPGHTEAPQRSASPQRPTAYLRHTDEASPLGLLSSRNHPRRAMRQLPLRTEE
jgi:hypothetical protein